MQVNHSTLLGFLILQQLLLFGSYCLTVSTHDLDVSFHHYFTVIPVVCILHDSSTELRVICDSQHADTHVCTPPLPNWEKLFSSRLTTMVLYMLRPSTIFGWYHERGGSLLPWRYAKGRVVSDGSRQRLALARLLLQLLWCCSLLKQPLDKKPVCPSIPPSLAWDDAGSCRLHRSSKSSHYKGLPRKAAA
jgi:hypothetical protein